LAGSVELVSQRVGLEKVGATLGEHASDRGLAAGYASRETYAEHRTPWLI
jgi:hypothetical protein